MATFAGIRTSGGRIVQPIGDEVIKQFQFSHATAGLNTGVVAYTPNIGDILLDCWIEVDTAFNGTTPLADVGDFVGTNTGIFFQGVGAVDLTNPDSMLDLGGGGDLLCRTDSAPAWSDGFYTGYANGNNRLLPARFVANLPLKLVVSTTGAKGGAATGATAGAGVVYFLLGTPQ